MTTTKTVLQKELIPRVDLDFMNDTHFEELEIVQELGELVTSYRANENQKTHQPITKKLNAWLDHTITHFERENELMLEIGFPAYPIHKDEHNIALIKMREVINTWIKEQNLELVENYIFTHWPSWFEHHVNTMDMITAQFAVMNGYTNH